MQTKKHQILLILAKIKRALMHNQTVIILKKKNYYYLTILQILYKYGFIQSFTERKNFFLIKLKEISFIKTQARPNISIQSISKIKQRKNFTVRSKYISKMQNIKSPATCFIFNTHAGILTGWDLTKKNIGGQSILKIV